MRSKKSSTLSALNFSDEKRIQSQNLSKRLELAASQSGHSGCRDYAVTDVTPHWAGRNPPVKAAAEVLCEDEDHDGTYVLPYAYQWDGEAWCNAKSGHVIEVAVVGCPFGRSEPAQAQ